MRPKTLQPHTGAMIMALYHYLRHPETPNFDVRMTEPRSKVYRITLEGKRNDELIFRTGKDWPCYSRIYLKSNKTEFRFRHDHSPVEEEFRIERKRLYLGRLVTEAGLRIDFEGEFLHPKMLELKEEYRFNGSLYTPRRYYEVERAW